MKCKNCGKIVRRKKGAIYCSRNCNSKYRYKKLKNNPDFKKELKDNNTRWRKENRERFNALVRPKAREYQRRIVKERKKKGLCIGCGRKPVKEKVYCLRCRKRWKRYRDKARYKKKFMKRKRRLERARIK